MMTADEVRERFRNIARRIDYGCGNHGCEFSDKKGFVGTNAICQCRRLLIRDLRELADAMEKRGEP